MPNSLCAISGMLQESTCTDDQPAVSRLQVFQPLKHWLVKTIAVIVNHPACGKLRRNACNGVFDVGHPTARNPQLILLEKAGNDLVLQNAVYGRSIQVVLKHLILEGPLVGQCPTGLLLITLVPPAIQHTKIQHAIELGLFATGAGSLQGPGWRVEPYVHSADQALGQFHVVVLQENYFPYKLRPP